MIYNPDEREQLLSVAKRSIAHGLETGTLLVIDLEKFSEKLREPRATFVTLERKGRLRGCIGALQATQPLVKDIANSAFNAAFRDPRFSPLQTSELSDLEIHISVLTPLEPLPFTTEQDLLSKIRPGVDGLLLVERNNHGTFLPAVWDDLPNPVDFLNSLKLKAGLPPTYWSDTIEMFRYTAECIP